MRTTTIDHLESGHLLRVGPGTYTPAELLCRMRVLTETERDVLRLRLGLAAPHRSALDVARFLGLSPHAVYAIEREACARLNNGLASAVT